MEITVDLVRPADLPEILAAQDRFFDGRDLRALHHPMFVHEFADTGLVARRDGELVGYLFGFVAPDGDGYVHLVAVRDDARGAGLARRLYDRFAGLAAERGARALKAITTPGNTGSLALHDRLGFTASTVADYGGPGADRVVLRRALHPAPGIGPARADEAGELLTLQRAAFLPETLRYGRAIPPVVEPLEEIRAAIDTGGVLVARQGGRLVGSVRAARRGTDGEIGRLVVAPDLQGRGLGTRLLRAAERSLAGVRRYVLSTGHASEQTLRLYARLGYRETHRGTDSAGVQLVYLARKAA